MKVLFICTHNRCRSILAEAIANKVGEGAIEAKSAGSEPSGKVHPLTLKYLQQAGVPISGLHSKSWNDLEDFHPDLAITVCDSAAQETCPVWMGKAVRLHWPLQDPSRVQGSDLEVKSAFMECMAILTARLRLLKSHVESGLSAQEVATPLGGY